MLKGPAQPAGQPDRIDLVVARMQAELEPARTALRPAAAFQAPFLSHAVRGRRALIELAQDLEAAVRIALLPQQTDPTPGQRKGVVVVAMDLAQRHGAAFAFFGVGHPERARDRQEGGEALRGVTGEVPDHRRADGKTAGDDTPGIDRPAPPRIVEHGVEKSDVVAPLARPAAEGPAAIGAVGGDEQGALVGGRRREARLGHRHRRALAIAVHEQHQRQSGLAVPAWRHGGQILAVRQMHRDRVGLCGRPAQPRKHERQEQGRAPIQGLKSAKYRGRRKPGPSGSVCSTMKRASPA